MRRPRRRPLTPAVAVLLLTGVALLAGGCRPLYLPPVPRRLQSPQFAQLGDASTLLYRGGTLKLQLVLQRIPKAAWLAVQWFAPDGAEVASASVWVTPDDAGQGRALTLPARVKLRAGEWRAVVSLGSQVLRQFRAELPAAAGTSR